MFDVIQGNKNPPIDYYSLHNNAFIRVSETMITHGISEQAIQKAIYHGVKMVSLMDVDAVGGIKESFIFIEYIKALIKGLTPNQLMRLFPVDKTYDGKRWQTKDYFSTMASLNNHGLDTPIGEAVDHILWDYMNIHISMFQVNLMSIVGKLHRAETGRDWFLDFFEEQGHPLTTYTEVTNPATGKRFMRNNDTGEMLRVRKPRARHLKLVTESS